MRKNREKSKVFVALSGGVDSSVAALLLKDQGHDVVGVFMRCFNLDGCAKRDAEDARRVAGQLGIPFFVWDFEKEYKERVVKYMIDGYRQGITPNPDVMCNKEIKFGLFFEKARSMSADRIATGHYVRLARGKLYCAKDRNKDQSYFLWTLTQERLAHCLFPIGDYLKPEVREMAHRAGLPTAEKKDSQGICFLGKISLADFLRDYIPAKRGPVFTTAGKKMGEHNGSYFYTIGQRHGLGIAGPVPYYVAAKNVADNSLTVAEGNKNPALYRKEVDLSFINWISRGVPKRPLSVFARVRYRQPLSKATIGNGRLVFASPQKFVAAGQSAVFYSKNGEMLGGGVIL
jgi:tRNA-specific 2-thiouridylase